MSTTIEAFGSTSLVEIGNNYFLQPNGGTAVELSVGGRRLWKLTGADQYLA
jgi:hypothetical protein